jgi:hypothetical protein
MVTLNSEKRDDGTLGVSLDISKANDVGPQPKQKIAFEFAHDQLAAIREAESWEFIKLDTQHEPTPKEQVEDYLLDIGKASATEIAKETGLSRTNVSRLISHDPTFMVVERKGQSVLYGIRSNKG